MNRHSMQKRILLILTNNIELKLIALVSSLFIWFWVQTKQTDQEKFRAQVEYILPEGVVLLSQPPPVVSVLLEGPKGNIRQFATNPTQRDNLTVEINLSSSKEGSSNPEFTANDVRNLPNGLRVIQFSPPIVNIVLDKKLTRTLSIKPNISGKPKKGWKLVDTNIDPESITLQGAQSVLSNLVNIQTMGISIAERYKSGKERVPLERKHPSFRFIGKERITVELIFEQIISKRLFPNTPIQVPEGWSANVSTVKLSLEGPMLEIEKINPKNIVVKTTLPKEQGEEISIIPLLEVYVNKKKFAYTKQITETILLKEIP